MSGFSIGLFIRRPEFGAVLSFVAVIAFYVAFGGVSLGTLFGAASWVNFAANLGIVALPVGLLMIAGELDISIGAMIPAGSMSIAILSGYYELPIVIGIFGALAIGVLVGLVNGFLAVRTSVPSLIITLGTLVAVQGLVLAGSVILTGAASVPLNAPAWAKTAFGDLIQDKFQVIILWWLALTVVFAFVLHATRYGNWIFAMGGDEVSARNAGIPTDRVRIVLFVLSSTAASFVGMCGAILFNSAQVSGGMTLIITESSRLPQIAPRIVPLPPRKPTPPSTAAAIEFSVKGVPMTGSPEPVCAATKRPVRAARRPDRAKAATFTRSTGTPERKAPTGLSPAA